MRSHQTTLYDRRGEEFEGSPGRIPSEYGPEIVEMPDERMAVARTIGDPERVMHLVLPALYSSVYKLNCSLRAEGKDFKLGHLRARWPDAQSESLIPRQQWHGVWGLPIPGDILSMPLTFLPRTFAHFEVEVETWKYGTMAQLTHWGASGDEDADIKRLRNFIAESGYEIAGPLEEEYLAGPEPSIEKIVVRFPVRISDFTLIGPAALESVPW